MNAKNLILLGLGGYAAYYVYKTYFKKTPLKYRGVGGKDVRTLD